MATTDPSELLQQRLGAAKQWMEATYAESNDQIRERFDGIIQNFFGSLEDLSDEQLRFPEAEGKWSIYDVCLHMSHAVRNVALLSGSLAQGEVPEMANDIRLGVLDEDPGDFPATRHQLVEAFDTAREIAKVFDRDYNTEATVTHPYFGPLNARQWHVFNLLHTNYHVGQIERIKSAPGFPS